MDYVDCTEASEIEIAAVAEIQALEFAWYGHLKTMKEKSNCL